MLELQLNLNKIAQNCIAIMFYINEYIFKGEWNIFHTNKLQFYTHSFFHNFIVSLETVLLFIYLNIYFTLYYLFI